MSFLHKTSICCHGDLKSNNCVIDSRWCCKITNVGLEKFKAGQSEKLDIGIDAHYNGEKSLFNQATTQYYKNEIDNNK